MADERIWNEIEEGLNEIYARFLNGESLRLPEMLQRIEKMHPFVVAAASGILRKMPHAETDTETVARRWWEIMEAIGLQKYDPRKRPLAAYAFVILRNICRGDERKGRRRKTVSIPFGSAVRSLGPSELAVKREWELAFRKAVRRLPKEPRRGFILKYILRKSSEEAAKRCGLKNVATFNTWTHRARTLLREQLAPPEWLTDSPIQRTVREARKYCWVEVQDDASYKETPG